MDQIPSPAMTARCFPMLATSLAIAFSSSGLVQKYFGLAGLVGYGIALVVFGVLFLRFRENIRRIVSGKAVVLGCVLMAILTGLFVTLYPIENARGVGKSSDRDQGLNIASSLLVKGEYPYYQDDDFAGPLSVLPGSIIFATPFVAMGNSAYQNIFWLAILMLFCAWHLRDPLLGIVLTAACVFLSPSALHEFISGGDLLTNGIFVAVLSMWALGGWSEKSPRPWALAGITILLGCALASRPNFLFLLPVFCTLIWSQRGFPRAVTAGAIVFGVTCLATLPFYFANPEGFTPLIARAKISIVEIPLASQAVIALTLFTSLSAAFIALIRPSAKPLQNFAIWGAVIIMCPMIAMILLASWAAGKPDFGFMSDRFGVMYLPFLLIAAGSFLRKPVAEQPCVA